MAINLSVPGAGGAVINIPFATQANESYASSLLAAIYTAKATGNPPIFTAYASQGTPPTPPAGDINEFVVDNNGAVTVPAGYQYILDDSSGTSSIVGGSQSAITYVAGQGGLTFTAGSGSGTVVAGGGNNTLYAPGTGSGNFNVVLDGSGSNAGYLGSGNWNVTTGTGSGTFFLGTGADTVFAQGPDTVVGGTGPETVSASGNGGEFFAGQASSTLLVDTGTGNIGVGGSGAETIFAAGSSGEYFTGNGYMEYLNSGNGNILVQQGSATVLAFGGTGSATYFTQGSSPLVLVDQSSTSTVVSSSPTVAGAQIFGGPGSVVNFYGPNNNNLFIAGAGNETLNAAGGSGNNVFFSGTGSDSLVGGSGSDFFIESAGTGSETLTGGGGSNTFQFVSHPGSNATDLITDFKSTDSLSLAGYGSAPGSGIQSETVQGGSLLVTLTDGTKITFNNVTQPLNSSQIHNT
ncbi:MAG: hypothetical protein JO264_21870 [Acidisphaera sp.]|nr:hypothetical protein [Acidisphaera sp.]